MTDDDVDRYFRDVTADGLRIAHIKTRLGYEGRAVIARTARQHRLAVIGRVYGCRLGMVLGWERLSWRRGWVVYPVRLPANEAVTEALRQAGEIGISFMRSYPAALPRSSAVSR